MRLRWDNKCTIIILSHFPAYERGTYFVRGPHVFLFNFLVSFLFYQTTLFLFILRHFSFNKNSARVVFLKNITFFSSQYCMLGGMLWQAGR